MSLLVPLALPARAESDQEPSRTRIPVWSLLLLGLAALAVSVAVIPHSAAAIAGLLAVGVVLVLVFIVVDRRASRCGVAAQGF